MVLTVHVHLHKLILVFLLFVANGTSYCGTDQLICDDSTKCIYPKYVCDGHRQCQDGQDENIHECKSRNTFPKQATVQCLEANRPDKYPIIVMAIPCDGNFDCKDGKDNIGCDISLTYLLCVLLIGFVAITILAKLFDYYHKQSKDFDQIELGGSKREDLTFEEWHQTIDRAKQIAFYQGASDKRLQNQALFAFEYSFHGNFASAMLCLKASTQPNPKGISYVICEYIF